MNNHTYFICNILHIYSEEHCQTTFTEQYIAYLLLSSQRFYFSPWRHFLLESIKHY